MENLFYWILSIIILVIGVYLSYTNITMAIKAKKAKALFLTRHTNARIETLSQSRVYIFGVLGVLCVISLFAYAFSIFQTVGNSLYSQIVIFLGLSLFCFSMALEAWTLSRLAICEDGFMVMDEYIRFKNVKAIDIGKGFFASSFVAMMDGKEISYPKYTLKALEPALQQYRQNRKERKKGRKKHA